MKSRKSASNPLGRAELVSRRRAEDWRRAEATLSDPHGVWCGWCLEYIGDNTELELHYVLAPKADIWKTFGVEPWTVPVHRDGCHRKGLQTFADEGGRELLNAREPTNFENVCKANFDRGYLPACMLLRRWAFVRDDDPIRAKRNLLFALNAAAGCGRGHAVAAELQQHSRRALLDDADVRLYAAMVRANSGDQTEAIAACADLDRQMPRVRRATSATYAKLARIRAIVTLRELNPAFLDQYRGAKARSTDRGPDWWTQGSSSMRKLLKGVLHTAAPNDLVLPWAKQNNKELDRNGRPTRATKVEWLCQFIGNDRYREYVRTEMNSALALFGLLDTAQHVDDFPEFEQQYDWTILRVEVAIRHILTIWKARLAR